MIDAKSAEWPSEKRWLDAQIAEAHKTLESPELTEAQTALLRGEIAAWRKRIELAERAAPTPPTPVVNYS